MSKKVPRLRRLADIRALPQRARSSLQPLAGCLGQTDTDSYRHTIRSLASGNPQSSADKVAIPNHYLSKMYHVPTPVQSSIQHPICRSKNSKKAQQRTHECKRFSNKNYVTNYKRTVQHKSPPPWIGSGHTADCSLCTGGLCLTVKFGTIPLVMLQ